MSLCWIWQWTNYGVWITSRIGRGFSCRFVAAGGGQKWWYWWWINPAPLVKPYEHGGVFSISIGARGFFCHQRLWVKLRQLSDFLLVEKSQAPRDKMICILNACRVADISMLQKMRPRCFRNDQEPSQTLCHSFRKTTWQWKVFLVLTFFWSCVQEGPFQDGPLESCTERFKFPTKNTTRHAVCRVFSASTHFWLAEINDVLKRSIVESSGLRNVLHLTTDLCKMKALLQKNQQRTNTKSTRLATQFKQLPTFHSMWLSLGHSY